MRVKVVAAGLALAAASGACAETPQPRTATARPAAAEEDERVPRVPHSCFGAEIRIDPSERGLSPGDVLRAPELGPEPPPPEQPEPSGQLSSVGRAESPRGEQAALAIRRAVEAAVPELRCFCQDDRNLFHVVVRCSEADGCETAPETGQAYVERIRPLLTPMVMIHLDTCACRSYY